MLTLVAGPTASETSPWLPVLYGLVPLFCTFMVAGVVQLVRIAAKQQLSDQDQRSFQASANEKFSGIDKSLLTITGTLNDMRVTVGQIDERTKIHQQPPSVTHKE